MTHTSLAVKKIIFKFTIQYSKEMETEKQSLNLQPSTSNSTGMDSILHSVIGLSVWMPSGWKNPLTFTITL